MAGPLSYRLSKLPISSRARFPRTGAPSATLLAASSWDGWHSVGVFDIAVSFQQPRSASSSLLVLFLSVKDGNQQRVDGGKIVRQDLAFRQSEQRRHMAVHSWFRLSGRCFEVRERST